MGCGSSKSVQVRVLTPNSSSGPEKHEDTHANHINVFEHAINNDNELVGSCRNAKPRLRSAIRRDTEIKPVTTDRSDALEVTPLDFTDQTLLHELQVNRDSGFDSNRANSEASDRTKSVREESGSVTASTMRPDSALTGSIITARDLNASFMTMSDDYMAQPNGDVTLDLDTPLEELTDFADDSHGRTFSNTPSRTLSNTPSRTLSNTPSARPQSSTPSRMLVSTEPFSVPLYPKNIDVIKEESEGGFTPRSIFSHDETMTPRIKIHSPKEDLPKYYSYEVLRHNQKAGWGAWGIKKGMVHDAAKVIGVFSDMHEEYARKENERNKSKHIADRSNKPFDSDDDSDGDEKEEEDTCLEYQDTVEPFHIVYPKGINPRRSLGSAIKILLNDGIPMDIVNQYLQKCVIGELVQAFSPKYWDSFRKDVNNLLEVLIRDDLRDELSENTKDVLEQLQSWITKYRDQNPPSLPQQSGDPNLKEFNLRDEIRLHPERLRQWVEDWEQFDFEIPESGAWFSCDIEESELGDPDEIFLDYIRSNVDLCNPFDTEVVGEAAWEVIEPGIIENDVLTAEQILTEESRRYRNDLYDQRRMERRRTKLMKYFVTKYEMDKSKVNHFLQWAHAMEDGHMRFKRLCGDE